ncbi:MAG: PAS domain S-box protein [Anaerolineales bacterium]|nr:PAS domain S-box protein [Anaerolineales bacterium]
MKADLDSVYYQALDEYLGEKESGLIEQVIPEWVRFLIVLGGGAILFLIVLGITSRAQVRTRTVELQENQSLLQTLVDSTTDAIFVKDAQGKYLIYSRGAEKSVGKPPSQVLGHDDYAVFPDNAEELIAQDQKIIAEGKPVTYEETLPDANGLLHTYLTTKGPLFDKNKGVAGIFGIARDITERKQTEQALLQNEEKYRNLFENAADGLFVLDEQSNVIELNGRICEMLGYPREELRMINAATLIHEDDAKGIEYADALNALLQGETIRSFYRLRKRWQSYPSRISHKDGGGRTLSKYYSRHH